MRWRSLFIYSSLFIMRWLNLFKLFIMSFCVSWSNRNWKFAQNLSKKNMRWSNFAINWDQGLEAFFPNQISFKWQIRVRRKLNKQKWNYLLGNLDLASRCSVVREKLLIRGIGLKLISREWEKQTWGDWIDWSYS